MQIVPLENIDWEKPCRTKVKDYAVYGGRLQEIDWVQHIIERADWKDPYFKADATSLLDPTVNTTGHNLKWRNYTWKRPEEVYGRHNYVIYDVPGPSDITQGNCGDCYYLASLSALAENPDRIKRIFLTQEVNDAGCYAVQMYINGERRTVVVDDYFPYDNERGRWAFSQPSESSNHINEIWVLILEKAWAKIYGSY